MHVPSSVTHFLDAFVRYPPSDSNRRSNCYTSTWACRCCNVNSGPESHTFCGVCLSITSTHWFILSGTKGLWWRVSLTFWARCAACAFIRRRDSKLTSSRRYCVSVSHSDNEDCCEQCYCSLHDIMTMIFSILDLRLRMEGAWVMDTFPLFGLGLWRLFCIQTSDFHVPRDICFSGESLLEP